MFGGRAWGLLGTNHFTFGELAHRIPLAFFLLQLVLRGTATTIISYAVDERIQGPAY